MAGRFKSVTIGSDTYQLPLQGSDPPWGEELSDLIDAMVDAINVTQGAGDITETSSIILNTAGLKDIVGLAFDPNSIRSAEISYNFSRSISKAISAIPTGTGVIQIDCSDNHNLATGDTITIASSNSTPSIDGVYSITKIDANSFSIDIGAVEITVAGISGSFVVELVESGTLLTNYGQQGWTLVRSRSGEALVDIDITTAGQAQYNPVVMDGTAHTGIMKFIAKALLDT